MSESAPATISTGRALEFLERARSANAAARIDAVTARVVTALEAAGVRCVLLKGPVLARWLYADGTPRAYTDTDLLVDPGRAAEAERCLGELGFVKAMGAEDVLSTAQHESAWIGLRGEEVVDLHWGLTGMEATEDAVWEELAASTERMDVGGVEIEVLGQPALALQVALHAAKHGGRLQTREDLARALRVTDRGTWEAAAALADRLGARDMLAAGLRLEPVGAGLADALGLDQPASTSTILQASAAAPGAVRFETVARAPTLAAKARVVLRTLVPTRRWMQTRTPRARRGGWRLAASYAWHPVGLLMRAAPAWRDWRRARATASRTRT